MHSFNIAEFCSNPYICIMSYIISRSSNIKIDIMTSLNVESNQAVVTPPPVKSSYMYNVYS